MVCELCCHRRSSLLPFAPRRGLWNGDTQRLMRAYEIEDCILKCEMAPQERALLRMRQCFAHQAPDTLARGEVVTLDISRVDLLAVAYLWAAAKYPRCTHRLLQDQTGLDERALMASQR